MVYGRSGHVRILLPDASIRVINITDPDNPEYIKHDVTSSSEGDYFRLLGPGKYSIGATEPGYEPMFTNITIEKLPDVRDGTFAEAQRADFFLVKTPHDSRFGAIRPLFDDGEIDLKQLETLVDAVDRENSVYTKGFEEDMDEDEE
ncbi:unnamed protein product [Dibothriocephalus latus]|uniref:Carboxypeptidase regulatory-like domain-containing protein n=1 Tax=Dibothriocephalus latus TaxID=60516 RepID=A0A3P7P0C6_DIBLA|nr:unnamed protein product [Dibothriocephalus latus]